MAPRARTPYRPNLVTQRPGADTSRSDRLERERAFHDDRFAHEHRQAAGKYYAVDTGRTRYGDLVRAAAGPGCTVLEYGCGTGSEAFALAAAGAETVGIDISGVGVSEATARARREGVNARFIQMDAEDLASVDGAFDLVCGSGILHHLDLERAVVEIRRVLKPGGVAVFYEPLGTNPLISLYRRLTPLMRTPDEHPLVPADFDVMRQRFTAVEVEHHTLLALAGAVLRKLPRIGGPLVRALQRADRLLLDHVRLAQRFAWVAVVRMRA